MSMSTTTYFTRLWLICKSTCSKSFLVCECLSSVSYVYFKDNTNLLQEEAVRNSLKAPSRDNLNPFKVPSKPMFSLRKPSAKQAQNKTKGKPAKSTLIPLDDLPQEVIEDMKYKPPKRFQPSNAAWITKRLYKFLESKLESK